MSRFGSIGRQWHLLHYREQFVERYPDLQSWFHVPLVERVGCLYGETRSNPSHPISFRARQYLYFLAFHGRLRFDWEWLIAAGSLGIWGQFERVGIQVDLEPFIQLGMRLKYSKTSIARMLQWCISRIFLHTGDFHVEHIGERDLVEFAAAIHRLGERPDIALFYGSAAQYRKQAKTYLAYLHRLHVILYHRGQVAKEPVLAKPRRVYSLLHKPRMEAVLARYLTARRLTDRPRTVKNFELALQRFIRWIEQAHPAIETFAEVTRDHVLQFAEEFDTLVHPRTKRPPGAGSKLIMLGRLAVFFRDVACWGWEDVPLHPLLQGRDLPRRAKSIPRYIPDDELTRLMSAVRALECPYQRAALLVI